MIHVLTVHHRDARFVNLQLGGLYRWIQEPMQTWAVCDGVDGRQFDHVVETPHTQHGPRLDTLAATILAVADDTDLLVFLDGDAWPVGDVIAAARRALESVPLVGVCRTEAPGGPWPHPLCTVTTVGAWRTLGAYWTPAYWHAPGLRLRWDVGAGVGNRLALEGVKWAAWKRRNITNLHPLWFAVYGNTTDPLIYHHGAGFRDKFSMASRPEDTPERIEAIGADLLDQARTNADFWHALARA